MSVYIKLSTLEYPRHEGDIRQEHPEIPANATGDSFPCPTTYALVEQTPPPTCDESVETVDQIAPVFESGRWISQWIVRPLTAYELEKQNAVPNRPTTEASTAPTDDDISEFIVEDANAPVETIVINP
jgi:hypothetical protein